MSLIEVEGISKRFGSQVVLDNTSISIQEGEILFIVGASGTGKSVFLEHLLGLQLPDSGSILVGNKNIVGLHEDKLVDHRRSIGYLFQGGALYDFLNIKENLAVPLQEHTDLSDEEIEKRVNQALKQVGLENVDLKSPSELSGGMLKRAALARAIILKPKMIFCDEPTSGLDPVTAGLINDLIKRCQHEFNMTVLVISHDVKSIIQIADRVAFLEKGKFAFIGTVNEFLKSDVTCVREYLEQALVKKEVLQ